MVSIFSSGNAIRVNRSTSRHRWGDLHVPIMNRAIARRFPGSVHFEQADFIIARLSLGNHAESSSSLPYVRKNHVNGGG